MWCTSPCPCPWNTSPTNSWNIYGQWKSKKSDRKQLQLRTSTGTQRAQIFNFIVVVVVVVVIVPTEEDINESWWSVGGGGHHSRSRLGYSSRVKKSTTATAFKVGKLILYCTRETASMRWKSKTDIQECPFCPVSYPIWVSFFLHSVEFSSDGHRHRRLLDIGLTQCLQQNSKTTLHFNRNFGFRLQGIVLLLLPRKVGSVYWVWTLYLCPMDHISFSIDISMESKLMSFL